MHAAGLIGRRITDVHWKIARHAVDWLDECDAWITLEDGTVIGFPWSLDDELWIRELPEGVQSAFYQAPRPLRGFDAFILWCRLRLRGIRTAVRIQDPKTFLEAKGGRIVDILVVEDPDRGAFIELDNGWLLSLVTVAPHGTGDANVQFYQTLGDMIRRHGEPTRRATSARTG